MSYRMLMSALLVALAVACGGKNKADDTTPTPAKDTDGACKVNDSVKATARVTPKEEGCTDKNKWNSWKTACESKDPAACYKLGVCIKLQSLMSGLTDAAKKQHFDAVLAATRTSCDAGMAKACLFRAGVLSEAIKEQPNIDGWKQQRCANLVRACQLGLGLGDGCAGCKAFECQGHKQ